MIELEQIKIELLKSLTFEYLLFLREMNMYGEGELNSRFISLERLKKSVETTKDENELDSALYWTISNFMHSLTKQSVSSVPHMIAFTQEILGNDADWKRRYQAFYA